MNLPRPVELPESDFDFIDAPESSGFIVKDNLPNYGLEVIDVHQDY